MKLDENSSMRLNALRFPLIVGVVFIHAYHSQVGLSSGVVGVQESGFISDFIRSLISQGVARVAVPLFFIMSGYFLFFGFSWSLLNYKKKLESRVKTLLVPFLFWNFLSFLIVALAQAIPATQGFFSGRLPDVYTLDAYGYVNLIFGFEQLPIAYHFWFIRDLIVLCLFMPLIFWLVRYFPFISVVSVLFLWGLNYMPLSEQSSLSITFFLLGAFLGYRRENIFSFDKYGALLYPLYFFVLLLDFFTKKEWINPLVHNLSIILGCIVALCLSKFLVSNKKVREFFIFASGASFFVFAAHEPLLTIVRKFVFKFFPPSGDLMVLLIYFFSPVFVISLLLLAFLVMKNFFPSFLRVISGGR